MTLITLIKRGTRNNLNDGAKRLTIGKIERRSTIAIGVKGYMKNDANLLLEEWR